MELQYGTSPRHLPIHHPQGVAVLTWVDFFCHRQAVLSLSLSLPLLAENTQMQP